MESEVTTRQELTTASLSCAEDDLLIAQAKAEFLFQAVGVRKLIRAGVTEQLLNTEIYQLAYELFGITKYWHKRIVRAGINTLCPYSENPPNLIIGDSDIVFLDFGPVFEEVEADFGKSYLLGHDARKQKMIDDSQIVFQESKQYYRQHAAVTGNELFNEVVKRSQQHGWLYGGSYAGHLIGQFPHEKRYGDLAQNYICVENYESMNAPDINGDRRHWILEVHLVDLELQCGAFFEDLLTLDRIDRPKIL